MYPEIVASCSQHVERISCCSGISTLANRSQVVLRCFEMRDGPLGLATSAGLFKAFTPNALMALLSIPLNDPTQISEERHTRMMRPLPTSWRVATTTARSASTTSLAPSKTQDSWKE